MELMEKAFDKYSLSARGYHRLLKVARTIADIDCSDKIENEHLSEAIQLNNSEIMGE